MKTSKQKSHIMDIVAERIALESKAPEMYEALKGLYELRQLIYYPIDPNPEHADESMAVHNAMTKIESLLKEIES